MNLAQIDRLLRARNMRRAARGESGLLMPLQVNGDTVAVETVQLEHAYSPVLVTELRAYAGEQRDDCPHITLRQLLDEVSLKAEQIGANDDELHDAWVSICNDRWLDR